MDGIVLINKEKGYTSHDVVAIVKKLTKSKVGHTGTLDPNATGVLPLVLGDATKISKYLINHDKEYEVVLQLGIKTTTADVEGEVLEEKEVASEIFEQDCKVIKKVLNNFIGKQQQIPPIYSAIKVNGKKLYDYARQGKQVTLEPRNIEIYSINLVNINTKQKQKQIQFKVKCSKGTYIRSLCEDIATKLGTVGYMKDLKRIQVGNFNIEQAVTIKQFENNINSNNFTNIISIENLFLDKCKINIPKQYIKPYINGVNIEISNIASDKKEDNFFESIKKDNVCRVYIDNKFTGLCTIKNNKIKRDIVIM